MIEADKFLLGKYVTLETLGIYNIGYFLASFPFMLSRVLGSRVMVSYYKNANDQDSLGTNKKARKLLFSLFGGMAMSVIPLVLIGTWLVGFLYDERYVSAGLVLVTLTAMHIPHIAQIPYQNAVLAISSARNYFTLMAIKAVIVVACIWIGLENFGLLGAILGQGVAMILVYPVIIFYARKVKAHDPLFDVTMMSIAGAALGLAWWLYSDQIANLIVY